MALWRAIVREARGDVDRRDDMSSRDEPLDERTIGADSAGVVQLDPVRHALGERVKELTALHAAARLLHDETLSVHDLLLRIAALLPPAFQYPEITCAEVRFGDNVSRTAGYGDWPWRLSKAFATQSGTHGAVDVRYTEERPPFAEGPFLAEERHLVDSLAEMLCVSLQQREIEADLKLSEHNLQVALREVTAQSEQRQVLLALTNAVSSTLDIAMLLERISALLGETIPHHFANLALWDEDAQALRRVRSAIRGDVEGIEQLPDRVPTGWPGDVVYRTGRTLVVRWADRHQFGEGFCRAIEATAARSGCGVPLETPRGRYGSLFVASTEDRDFPPEEVRLLEQIAQQFAIAIENALHYQQAERYRRSAAAERDRLQLLLEVTNAIASELELEELLRAVSQLLRTHLPDRSISIALWDADAQRLRRHTLTSEGPAGLMKAGALIGDRSPSHLVYRSGMTHVFRWADIVEHGEPARSILAAEGLQSLFCTPLQTHRARHGTLNVARREDEPFSDEEVRLLEQVAGQVAIAIENALHYEQAERYRRSAAAERDRLQLLLDLTNAITSELELKDLIPTVSRLLEASLKHHYVSVTLWDVEAQRLRRHALVFPNGTGVIQAGALVTVNAPSHLVYMSGETRVFRWADILELGEPVVGIMAAEGLRSVCCVPMQTPRARHGTLNVARPDDMPFTATEVLLLEQIARQIAIAIENAVAFEEISTLKDRLTEEKIYLQGELTERADFSGITGSSRAMRLVLDQIRTVAPTDATVLLLGETGTGKEVVARSIHDSSRRRQQTFVRVNAAALPSALVESELFGYEKGAFTGAAGSKVGRIELAHRGTLFLDEIGDMPIDVQPKLLRALQEHEFERLGSTRTQRVDVRLIAATNRNLEAMVEAGSFRSDLFYRLNVFPIELPPLRDRPEDIAALVEHFVGKFAREMGRTITHIPATTLRQLQEWRWPGNIRELQNVIERAVILSPGDTLQVPVGIFKARPAATAFAAAPAAAPAAPTAPAGATSAAAAEPRAHGSTFRDAERETILRALREARGIIGGPDGAAARLGIKRTTLNSKMRKLGITRPMY